MKDVLLALNQQPIAVYPIYIDITGSMTAGVLLSQVMYWDSKMKGNEFYKNDAEFMQETRLTQSEFKTAKKIIGDLPFITIQRKGVPCRTWYSVNHSSLLVVLQQFSSSFTYQLGSRLSTSQRGVNLRTIIGTENTQEITSENTTGVEKEFSTVLIDADEELVMEIHHIDSYFDTEQKDPTPQVAPTPRPKAKREPKYVYPPTQEELVPMFFDKLTEKKRDHPQIVDCWNWANMEAEKFFLHWERKGWTIQRLPNAIATWVNGSITYGTVTKPCPIQYKNNPDTQQPTPPTQPVQQERPVLTQHDIEATAQNVAAVSELFKNMGVRV